MKPPLTVAVGLLVLVLVWILWREGRLAAELDALHATVASMRAANREVSAPNRPSFPQGSPPISGLPADAPPADANRLDAIEAQQREVIDSLNWAIEQVNRNLTAQEKASRRAWGPEQVIGDPDTSSAGDHPTAWAPREQDAGEEWLQLGFEQATEIAQVRVRETLNPGAITRVSAVLENGSELTLWQGNENAGPAPYDATFNAPPGIVAKRVKVYLDTRRTPGWEEIDAVELIGRDGTRQWAGSASASSTYASPLAQSADFYRLQFGGDNGSLFLFK